MPFDAKRFIEKSIRETRKQIGDARAVIAVSGGVDSSVAAALVHEAIGKQLVAVFVDTGFMRLNEAENAKKALGKLGLNLKIVDASERFMGALAGVSDPEEKRRRIGELFVRVFEDVARREGVSVLAQGTIAPDWIESGGGARQRIKSHHNVAGLPSGMTLRLCEPLRELYKHEVRALAKALALPAEITERQPFPGPGLAVRVVGEITPEKVEIVRKACAIVEEEIENAVASGAIEKPWQYFAALLPARTVGVRGDERAYQHTVLVRAVRSLDGMTANFSPLPAQLLERISTRITNEIREAGRVVYDITNKPPGTIEME